VFSRDFIIFNWSLSRAESWNKNMKELLDRLIEAKYKENSFFYDKPIKPKPGEPPSKLELQQLESHLVKKGFKVPYSYKQYLSIYNGIENLFDRKFSLLSISEIVKEEFEILEENIEEFPSCCEFVIGAGDTPEFIGFDVSKFSGNDGYQVVWIADNGEEWRLNSFEDFLTNYLSILERNVLIQEKDRENLLE
jgi:hypothetical protein